MEPRVIQNVLDAVATGDDTTLGNDGTAAADGDLCNGRVAAH